MLTRVLTALLYLVLAVAFLVMVAGCSNSPTEPARSAPATATQTTLVPPAVCSTDSDCAEWEVRQGVPESERCYGAPCPAKPQHHNIPVTMETGEPDGSQIIVWVCETQPRYYHGPQGLVVERDHYISRDRCPEIPIQ